MIIYTLIADELIMNDDRSLFLCRLDCRGYTDGSGSPLYAPGAGASQPRRLHE